MKKTILLMMILCLPFVFSMYSGETASLLVIDNCEGNIVVSVTGDQHIDANEYTIENCNINYTIEKKDNVLDGNTWSCYCDGTYYLNMTTTQKTVNFYHITADYNYWDEEEVSSSSSGGGSGSSGYYYKAKKNKTVVINTTTSSGYDGSIEPVIETPEEDVITEPVVVPYEPKKKWNMFFIVVIGLALIGVGGYAVWRYRKNGNTDKE